MIRVTILRVIPLKDYISGLLSCDWCLAGTLSGVVGELKGSLGKHVWTGRGA